MRGRHARFFFMMFYHVPKRLQIFFALRAIILMPYESVPMYGIRAFQFALQRFRAEIQSAREICVQLLVITAEVRSEGRLDGSDRNASWEWAFACVYWWGSSMPLDWTSTGKVGG